MDEAKNTVDYEACKQHKKLLSEDTTQTTTQTATQTKEELSRLINIWREEVVDLRRL